MTLPGPSTMVDGMADDYYGDERALAMACADVLNQEIRALAAAGCDMVQLDEPAFTRLPEKLHAWGVEAMDRAFAGTNGRELRARLLRLPRAARQQGVEARLRGDLPGARARERSTSTRSSSPSRSSRRSSSPACRARSIQLGVIDVGTDEVERPETVAARLRAALEVLPPERLIAAPDCGCVARDRAATRAKLRAMVLGTQAVRLELEARS